MMTWRQAISRTKTGLELIWTPGTYCNEIVIKIQVFIEKINVKMSSANVGLNVLKL